MPDQTGESGSHGLHARLEELEATNRELIKRNLQLVQFVNILANDLRSPLRHIMGFCRIVQHESASKLGSRGKSFLENVVVSARRIRELVDDLVTLTRVQHDEFTIENVDMAEIFNYVTISLAQPIRESKARVSCGPLPKVQANSLQMRILLQNLIDNALKYRAPDRRPEVRIEAERNELGWKIAVRDNGQGIDPQRFEGIFDAFQRSGKEDNSYTSSGLGLFVCKEIAERHEGSIWLESSPDGTAFFFTLVNQV